MNNLEIDTNYILKNLKKSELNFFKNKKILILGSDGFIGSYFVEFFIKLIENKINVKVDCVDNHISSSKRKLSKKKLKLKALHTEMFHIKYHTTNI